VTNSPSPSQSSFGSISEPGSHSGSHTIGVDRGGPLWDFSRGYSSLPPTPHGPQHGLQLNTFQNPNGMYPNNINASVTQSMENMMKLVLQEVQQMNQRISSVESTNKNILTSQEQLTARIQATEDGVRRVEATVAQTANSKKSAAKTSGTSKNISNQHLKLKVRITLRSIT